MEAIIGLIGAVVGAFIGAYLQKRWTPDYSGELTKLRDQVAAFQQRVETLEQEHAELQTPLPVRASLNQAHSGGYSAVVENCSDDMEILIETVNLKHGDVELSRPTRPRSSSANGLRLAPRTPIQIEWKPEPDPVGTLRMKEPNLPREGVPMEIKIVLGCQVRGKRREVTCTKIVTIDARNYRMTQYGP